MAHHSQSHGSGMLSGLQDTVSRGMQSITDQMGASSTASDLARRGRWVGEEVQSSAVMAMRERPIATIVAVAVISFALGALWRS
jgi:hypothetical protein